MDTFNIIVGVVTILSFLMSLFATTEVIKIKKQVNTETATNKGTQLAIGTNNRIAGRDIND
jgi:hypothetical protein